MAILLLCFLSVFLPSSTPRHTGCVPNMVKWRKCEIIINNIYWFPRYCTQQSDVNSALSYLHSYLIYFLTDVKHNHKQSEPHKIHAVSAVHRCNGWGPVWQRHVAENMTYTAKRCKTIPLGGYRREKKLQLHHSVGGKWRKGKV